MKFKTKYLSVRVKYSVAGGLGLMILYLLCYEVAACTGWLAAERWTPHVFTLCGLLLLIVYLKFTYHYLYLAYREIETVEEDFANHLVADEVFEAPYALSCANDKVLQKFKSMLNQRELMELSVQQSQYLALQNQINPHFLYNTLDAIRADAIIAGENHIADTIEALSTFFAYTISNMDQLATLYEELDHVRDYFYIQKYRFEERLELEIRDFRDVEDLNEFYVPRLTLQPLVENAIYHGLEGRGKCGTVTISFEQTVEHLIIHVMDDGLGMNEDVLNRLNSQLRYMDGRNKQEHKHGGIALGNVNSRIKLLFGEDYGLRLYSVAGHGTDVRVLLPKVTKDTVYEKRIPEDCEWN